MNKAIENLKNEIIRSLNAFGKGSLHANATQLFNTLGYTSEKTIYLSPNFNRFFQSCIERSE